MSKIPEKIMYKRVYNFLNNNSLIYTSQHGFRNKHSCESAVGELIGNVCKGHEKGKHTLAIFLDLSKAFDTISHNIPFRELGKYGIRGQALKWFLHLSEEDDDSSEKSSLSPTESEVFLSDHEDVIARESLAAKIMTAPPDILNKDCKVKLDRLTDDEISMWTKTETIPEFPAFVKGREVGGYTMWMKTPPAKLRHKTRPRRGHSTPKYEDLDTEPEVYSPKKPARKHKPVPKDGPSAERLAAHRFYLHSKPKTDSDLGDNRSTRNREQTYIS